MSRYTADALYRLLPAVYRVRDAETGGSLRAVIEVLASQAEIVEDDIANLYENWFIETCDEWVVPYIGALLGVHALHQPPGATGFSQRARIANTLGYRRRKGTATMLEQLARDTTGWNARAVEYFQLLATTQNVNHVRLANVRTADLRQAEILELLNTPFDTIAHTVDVRAISAGTGRHNIPSIGLHLWRLQSYAVSQSYAAVVGAPADLRFTFDPLGKSQPLFNRPQAETEITALAGEVNVSAPLRRRPLFLEFEELRQAEVDQRSPAPPIHLGATPPFRLWRQAAANAPFVEIPADRITIADLSDADGGPLLPATPRDYLPTGAADGTPAVPRDLEAAVDPQLGRIALLSGTPPHRLRVSYAYGFSGDVGAGPYNRRDSVDAVLTRRVTWQRAVAADQAAVANESVTSLAGAIAEWNTFSAASAGAVGVIAVLDSATYAEDLTGVAAIRIPDGSLLMIVAADWPKRPVPGGPAGQTKRVVGELEADDRRPHLRGNIHIVGTAPVDSSTPGLCVLNGLMIEGSVSVKADAPANLGGLRLDHCTVVPPANGLVVEGGNTQLTVSINRTICGAVALTASCPQLSIDHSIIDGGAMLAVPAITAPGTTVALQAVTALGTVTVRQIEAGNCLFTAPVTASRLQEGCVRFSHLPPSAGGTYATPRRFRCQPELAQTGLSGAAAADVAIRLTPVFNDLVFGGPAYAQLSQTTAVEVREGAEDGAEMGAFTILKQPQRLANLTTSLPDFLPFGMDAGFILET